MGLAIFCRWCHLRPETPSHPSPTSTCGKELLSQSFTLVLVAHLALERRSVLTDAYPLPSPRPELLKKNVLFVLTLAQFSQHDKREWCSSTHSISLQSTHNKRTTNGASENLSTMYP